MLSPPKTSPHSGRVSKRGSALAPAPCKAPKESHGEVGGRAGVWVRSAPGAREALRPGQEPGLETGGESFFLERELSQLYGTLVHWNPPEHAG